MGRHQGLRRFSTCDLKCCLSVFSSKTHPAGVVQSNLSSSCDYSWSRINDSWVGVWSSSLLQGGAGTLEGKAWLQRTHLSLKYDLLGHPPLLQAIKIGLMTGSFPHARMLSALFPFLLFTLTRELESVNRRIRNDAITSPIASSKERNAIHWHLRLLKIPPRQTTKCYSCQEEPRTGLPNIAGCQ